VSVSMLTGAIDNERVDVEMRGVVRARAARRAGMRAGG
jgi:hypothetical protein